MEYRCEICNKTSKDRGFKYYHKKTKRHILIEKYGKEKGLEFYKKWYSEVKIKGNKKIKENRTPEEYQKFLDSHRSNTEDHFINKFGEEIGKIKWKERCEENSKTVKNRNLYDREYRKNWKYNNSLKGFIDKYGQKKGEKKWNMIQEKKGKVVRREYFLEESQANYDLADWLLSQRQATFSLKKCIKQYGEDEGTEIWKQRQENWQNTLKSKPQEEIERINRSKISHGCNISKNEYKIINELKMYFSSITHQFTIYPKRYVYDFKINNKIIEYNGDYWHCNPEKYNENYFNTRLKMTAKEKWEKDNEKIKYAKENGYDVFIIWEKDYCLNPRKEIQKCLDFINE